MYLPRVESPETLGEGPGRMSMLYCSPAVIQHNPMVCIGAPP